MKSINMIGKVGVGFCLCALFLVVSRVDSQIVKKIFSCEGRPSGYYADVQSGCQIYHMCDGLGRQFSYSCPNTTLFQQRMLICDHWYMVNCSKSETDYKANLLIGQKGKPFVEDDEENPYHRTPRPDLLANPSAAEYNIIYRSSRAQQDGSGKNLVEEKEEKKDDMSYFLPSHWSTEFYAAVTETPKLEDNKITNFESHYEATTPVYPKVAPKQTPLSDKDDGQGKIKTVLQPPVGGGVNFESNYKATTPVYPEVAPKEVPLREESENEGKIKTVLVPPVGGSNVNFESEYKATTPVYPKIAPKEVPLGERQENDGKIRTVLVPPVGGNVNFESKYKATTPVYPKTAPAEIPLSVGGDTDGEIKTVLLPPITDSVKTVNFESDYKATTPVYPKSAPKEVPLREYEDNLSQHKPNTILLPPNIKTISDRQDFVVNFESNYKATTPVYPSSVTPEIPLASEQMSSENPKAVPYGISTIIEPPKKGTKRPKIIFQSPFKATTPNYPKFAPSEIPLAIEEPKVDPNSPSLSTVIQPPRSYEENKFNTVIQQPSLFYEPPAYNYQTTNKPGDDNSEDSLKWKELRRLFLIPDFQFPLDVSAVRPNYNEGPNSFQVNPFSYEIMQRDHAYD